MLKHENWDEGRSEQFKRVQAREKREARMALKYSQRRGQSVFKGHSANAFAGSLNSGSGRGENQDVLQPGLYGGSQQGDSQDASDVQDTPGQAQIPHGFAKKLGLKGGAPKISPGDQPFRGRK